MFGDHLWVPGRHLRQRRPGLKVCMGILPELELDQGPRPRLEGLNFGGQGGQSSQSVSGLQKKKGLVGCGALYTLLEFMGQVPTEAMVAVSSIASGSLNCIQNLEGLHGFQAPSSC